MPRLPWLVLGLVAAALLAVGSLAISTDTWLGVAGGRELLQHGFSSATAGRATAAAVGRPAVGRALVFYGVWQIAGPGRARLTARRAPDGGVRAVRARGLRRGGGPVWAAILLIAVAVASVGELVFVRTQSFSVLWFGLLAWLLARDDGRLEGRVLLALPLLMVWANLHAAVLVGAACAGCTPRRASRGAPVRSRASASGSCWRWAARAACLATPFAPELPATWAGRSATATSGTSSASGSRSRSRTRRSSWGSR